MLQHWCWSLLQWWDPALWPGDTDLRPWWDTDCSEILRNSSDKFISQSYLLYWTFLISHSHMYFILQKLSWLEISLWWCCNKDTKDFRDFSICWMFSKVETWIYCFKTWDLGHNLGRESTNKSYWESENKYLSILLFWELEEFVENTQNCPQSLCFLSKVLVLN